MDGRLVHCLFLLCSSGWEIENGHAFRQPDDAWKSIPPPCFDTTLVMQALLLQVQPPEDRLLTEIVEGEVQRSCQRIQFGILLRSADDHSVMREQQG